MTPEKLRERRREREKAKEQKERLEKAFESHRESLWLRYYVDMEKHCNIERIDID